MKAPTLWNNKLGWEKRGCLWNLMEGMLSNENVGFRLKMDENSLEADEGSAVGDGALWEDKNPDEQLQ